MDEKMSDAILITGAARSGTSMIAGIVAGHGAFGGDMQGPNQWNKKGMFENLEIRNKIVKPYLESVGADRVAQRSFPDMRTLRISAKTIGKEWNEKVMAVLEKEGYRDGRWFCKCPKACIMWPIWHAAFPSAKWIIVYRNPSSVIDSCMRVSFMRAYRDKAGWSLWYAEHAKRCADMQDAGLDVSWVKSDDVVRGDYVRLREAIEHAGLEWDESIVNDFVSPELFHSKEKVAV